MKAGDAVLAPVIGHRFSGNPQILLAKPRLHCQYPDLRILHRIVVFIANLAAYQRRRYKAHRNIFYMFTGSDLKNRLVFALAIVREKSCAIRHQPVDAGLHVLEEEMAPAVGTLRLAACAFQVQQRHGGAWNRPAILDVDDRAFNHGNGGLFRSVLGSKRGCQRQCKENRSMSARHAVRHFLLNHYVGNGPGLQKSC